MNTLGYLHYHHGVQTGVSLPSQVAQPGVINSRRAKQGFGAFPWLFKWSNHGSPRSLLRYGFDANMNSALVLDLPPYIWCWCFPMNAWLMRILRYCSISLDESAKWMGWTLPSLLANRPFHRLFVQWLPFKHFGLSWGLSELYYLCLNSCFVTKWTLLYGSRWSSNLYQWPKVKNRLCSRCYFDHGSNLCILLPYKRTLFQAWHAGGDKDKKNRILFQAHLFLS